MPTFPLPYLALNEGRTIDLVRREDAPALVEAFADWELRRWLPVPTPYTLEHAASWCTTISTDLRTTGRGLVLAVREQGRLIASIDAKRVDWRAMTVELSYWTTVAQRGRGLMTAAIFAVGEWLISDLRFERVELRIAPDNFASLRVAERAGFTREGVARNAGFTDDGRTDLIIHSLVPTDIAQRGVRHP